MKVNVPPIKPQGIKTKLVTWIRTIVPDAFEGLRIEPFMGSGVVAFNLLPDRALLCDTNPHLINFYNALAKDDVTPKIVRDFLTREGETLSLRGERHYYEIRDRFNREKRPLDFLFLNRACFNGMIRFNRKSLFNVPFCRKSERLAKAYITKIVNQVSHVIRLLSIKDFTFKTQSFEKTLTEAGEEGILYCDPPYIDRHTDYYNVRDKGHEKSLYKALSKTPSRFILSTWHHNHYRDNVYMDTLWHRFDILTHDHFYHLGANERNRHPMVEALATNYDTSTFVIRNRNLGGTSTKSNGLH